MKAPDDLLAALRGLSPERIVARIDALDAERAQLLILLRGVRARERLDARRKAAGRPAGKAKTGSGT